MGFERSHIFGKIEVEIRATGTGTFALSTDVPGAGMVQRFSFPIPITGRRVVRSRLPGAMVGHLVSATYTPDAGGQSEIYGARVWVRELPAGAWYWFPLPVVETPVLFQPIQIPVEPTPAEFARLALPVEPTPESWSAAQIPVEPTPAEFARLALPVEPTPESWSAAQIPVEPTPATFTEMRFPVPSTPEEYASVSLPVKPTPPVPQWIEVEVDQ